MVARRDIVVIGASAGGVEALLRLAAFLPFDLEATVLVTLHTSAEQPHLLPDLLGREGPLAARYAEDGDRICPGEILIAPPDVHMLVDKQGIRLTHGPRENGFRPAIDPLFRTAADTFGPRVIGVILSGALDDGAHGLLEIKEKGGLALVQDVEEALFPSMPLAALRGVEVDHVLRATDLARKIAELTGVAGTTAPAHRIDEGAQDTARGNSRGLRDRSLSRLPATGFTCPQCGGALWEERQERLLGYRCHVGHRYGETSLLAHQAGTLEAALWTALRVLEEAVALRRRMAQHALESGLEGLAAAYLDGASAAERDAELLRRVVKQPPGGPGTSPLAEEHPDPTEA